MQELLLKWYDREKRDLPWRQTQDPYAVWVSEIMLQQTRAETVRAYWTRFLQAFPTVQALARAEEETVLKLWEGLGYYSRARNLHWCAQAVCERFAGRFPEDVAGLRSLPGIGAYTAGAVASIAFGVRTAAVDGNVERVVARLRGIREDVGTPSVRRALLAEAEALVPAARPGDFNQAMMELGARICLPAPRCELCPIRAHCDAFDAGDAVSLPVRQRKAPPRAVPMGMALVFHGDRVLLRRREEALLRGLWCFPGYEGETEGEAVAQRLAADGVCCTFLRTLGHARHVFTHRVWEMTLLSFSAASDACPPGWQWADREQLAALPLPTAVRAARALAVDILQATLE